MKTLTKVLLLTFFLIGGNLIDAYSSITITIHIARHRDCKGLGWCKMQAVYLDDGSAPADNVGKAEADITVAKNFVVKINRKTDITPKAYQAYFSKGSFVCEDDFPIPPEILKALGYAGSYTIKEGSYPIKLDGDIMTIVF